MDLYTNGYIIFDVGFSIYLLHFDLNTEKGIGSIFTHNLDPKTSLFARIKAELHPFSPTKVFVATWDRVSTHSPSSSIASFQIILSTDLVYSFVTIKYITCLPGQTLSSPSTIHYVKNGSSAQFLMANPCTSSNIDKPGTWVFNVTST